MKKIFIAFLLLGLCSFGFAGYKGDGLGNHKAKKNLEIPNSGTDTNSFKLYFYSNLSGTSQYSSMYAISGADPYLRISVPNNSGTETPILDLHDTVMAFVTDGLTSIGGISDNRPSDVNIKYGVKAATGDITGNFTVGQTETVNNLIVIGSATIQILDSIPVIFVSTDLATGCVVYETTVTYKLPTTVLVTGSHIGSNDVSGSITIMVSTGATIGGTFTVVSTGAAMSSNTEYNSSDLNEWIGSKTIPKGTWLKFCLAGATPVSVQSVTYQLDITKYQ